MPYSTSPAVMPQLSESRLELLKSQVFAIPRAGFGGQVVFVGSHAVKVCDATGVTIADSKQARKIPAKGIMRVLSGCEIRKGVSM